MPLPASDMRLPALLGMEYLDPMGSGLSVPVLGCQRDPVSGNAIPLAGTMEDPKGKGTLIITRTCNSSFYSFWNNARYLYQSIKHVLAPDRLGGDPLWSSGCGSSDWAVGPSGWSAAGCAQQKHCAYDIFILADDDRAN